MAVLGLDKLFGDLDDYLLTWQRRRDEIPYEFKTSIISQIIRTGSIDTTRFIRAVDFREEMLTSGIFGGYRYLIDSARDSLVTYDAFVELPGVTRNWSGRFNYQGGIENARLESIFDSFADTSFAR